MSTPNFSYSHRCVVVTDDNFDRSEYPPLGEPSHQSNRYYPSTPLAGYDYTFWQIVITSGYYSGACIDYIKAPDYDNEAPEDILRKLDYLHTYQSVKDFLGDLFQSYGNRPFGISSAKVRKIFTGITLSTEPLEEFLYQRAMTFIHQAAAIEAVSVNKAIDAIKERYSFHEYTCICILSNGEAIYQKLPPPREKRPKTHKS